MWRDEAYLLDILIAARKALRYVQGASWESFKEDDRTQDAVIRNLQVIGEAARKISEEFQGRYPEIPWGEIIGMRHRLIHDYSRIDVVKIWDTAQNDIPSLIRWIEPLVPSEDQV